MLLTFSEPAGGYTGGAYEGVAFLPWVGEKLSFILTPLFGFSSPESISVPIMSLGAAGAAISVVPRLVSEGLRTRTTSLCLRRSACAGAVI